MKEVPTGRLPSGSGNSYTSALRSLRAPGYSPLRPPVLGAHDTKGPATRPSFVTEGPDGNA